RLGDGRQHLEQPRGTTAQAELGLRAHQPERRVGVLAAVLADAGNVTLDVAGIVRRAVEWRREEPDDAVVHRDQLALGGVDGAGGTLAPRPSRPTRFIPSFQSPVPMSGKPCAPRVSERSRARQQCVYTSAVSPEGSGRRYVSSSPGSSARAVTNGACSSSTLRSPVV